MGGQAFNGRARLNGFYLHPSEDLCIIGKDTKHRSRTEHVYYDERALLPSNPLDVENAYELGIIKDVLFKRMDCTQDARFPKVWRDKGKVAILIDGRQRTGWAREATVLRQQRNHIEPVVWVPSREITGSELQIWLRSRAANAVGVATSPTGRAREMLELRGMGCSDETVANTYACSVAEVEEYLRLLDLSPRVVTGIESLAITRSAAKLFREMTHEEQDAQLDRLEQDGFKLTVENVRAAIRSTKPKTPKAAGEESESGIKLSLKQICKMATLATSGEIDVDPTAKKVLRILKGDAGPAGIKGMKDLLRAVGCVID